MKTTTTNIPGLLIFELDVHQDARGWFKENWQRAKQPELNTFYPVQNNISFNEKTATTRGIHAEPWDKYVSVTTGRVFAAWVDLRENHEPNIVQLEITPNIAVFVPKGVGNSYQTLEDNTAYTYLVNDHYDPALTYPALNLNHPGINWPIALDQANISEKDLKNPTIKEAIKLKEQKTLIIGNGQLAKALLKIMPNATQLTRQQLDLEQDFELDLTNVETVINAAAYTRVDQAEDEPALAFKINATATAKLAQLTKAKNVKLVHISSDYVFDGTKAEHTEDETMNPLNTYGLSKAAGDIAAQINPNHLIIRTSWVIGDGENFIEKIKTIANPKVVTSQHGRPTFTHDLAKAIQELLLKNQTGTFNVTNEGPVTTWFEIAKLANPSTEPIGDYPAKAKRPEHSTLNLSKLNSLNIHTRNWREALSEYLEAN